MVCCRYFLGFKSGLLPMFWTFKFLLWCRYFSKFVNYSKYILRLWFNIFAKSTNLLLIKKLFFHYLKCSGKLSLSVCPWQVFARKAKSLPIVWGTIRCSTLVGLTHKCRICQGYTFLHNLSYPQSQRKKVLCYSLKKLFTSVIYKCW